MKASKVNFQGYKTFIGKSWDLFSHQTWKVFLLLVILCAGCVPSSQITAMLPVTGAESETNIVFSPDNIDFGFQILETTSSAQKVTIRNVGADPLVIDDLSVTAGFSIVADTCVKVPDAIASQGSCTVEIVFKPNLPRDWVGELQLNYDTAQVITLSLKGFAQPKNNLFALILSDDYRSHEGLSNH